MEEHEIYSGLILKIRARSFFCTLERDFSMNCSLFWEAVRNQKQSEHNLALAAVQNTRNRQAEIDLQNKDVMKDELLRKSVKTVAEEKQPRGQNSKVRWR